MIGRRNNVKKSSIIPSSSDFVPSRQSTHNTKSSLSSLDGGLRGGLPSHGGKPPPPQNNNNNNKKLGNQDILRKSLK